MSGSGLDGTALWLDEYAGSTVVVNVWGSWCVDCRLETDQLVTAARVLAKRDVHFLGIDIRDTQAAAQAYVKANGVTWPSIFDPDSSTLLRRSDGALRHHGQPPARRGRQLGLPGRSGLRTRGDRPRRQG
ncbi:MAG: TlpA family protein disulfide reductase [Nocardioidaceae bacterium]